MMDNNFINFKTLEAMQLAEILISEERKRSDELKHNTGKRARPRINPLKPVKFGSYNPRHKNKQ